MTKPPSIPTPGDLVAALKGIAEGTPGSATTKALRRIMATQFPITERWLAIREADQLRALLDSAAAPTGAAEAILRLRLHYIAERTGYVARAIKEPDLG